MESKTENLYQINDEELIYMVSENSDDAKEMLYQKYSAMVHSELNKVKKTAYALDIDFSDVTQEALLGLNNAINIYDTTADAQFGTFATLCVRRRILNYIDKCRTAKNLSMNKALSLNDYKKNDTKKEFDISDLDGREPLNRIITQESLIEISKKIDSNLTKNEKLVLKYATAGKSTEEISKLMGINIKKVYNLLYRARKKIKN